MRTDTAQIMFDYLISQKFSDTMNAMLSPIFKMNDQLETEKRAIQKQWAMREKMIEDIITNANFMVILWRLLMEECFAKNNYIN